MAKWQHRQGHDYNLFCRRAGGGLPQALRPMLDAAGLQDVGVTPGECTNWYRFSAWGYADAIADEADTDLGLITSYGLRGLRPVVWRASQPGDRSPARRPSCTPG
jgi:hypothetical protein